MNAADLGESLARPARVLLVENAKLFHQLVAAAIAERLDVQVLHAYSLADAAATLEREGSVDLVLTGLVLADGDQESIVDFFLSRQLPTVIVTGMLDEGLRERLLQRPIVDYVVKNTPGAVEYVVWLVRRLERNRRITALVVDDAASARMHAASLLKLYGFRVAEAESGEAGLSLLERDPSIRLVITDQEMPGMDGVEFTRRLRARHPRDSVSVIGVSGAGKSTLVAQFLKNGANDFLHKPFSREEFFCRVSQNVENLELIGSLQDLATKDFLTGLANRRHFFARGAELLDAAQRERRRVCVAMLDIDFFKKVNDTFGHDGGDVALKAVAQTLARFVRPRDLVARFGGEEFALLAVDLGATEAEYFFEGLRARIEDLDVRFNEQRIPITVSIGVCVERLESLDAMLSEADRLLYLAKAGGRNQVRRSDQPE